MLLWVLVKPEVCCCGYLNNRVDNSSVGLLKGETQLGANWLKADSAGIDTSIKSRGVNVVLLD